MVPTNVSSNGSSLMVLCKFLFFVKDGKMKKGVGMDDDGWMNG